jgi:hypothetical protein
VIKHSVDITQRTKRGLPKYFTTEYCRFGGVPGIGSWISMIKRCYYPGNRKYKHYGARGIRVCERWLCSFEAFIEDVGSPPAGCTIHRKNNDRDYEPGNCNWATSTEQNRHKRASLHIRVGKALIPFREYLEKNPMSERSARRLAARIRREGVQPSLFQ